jgi:hypothetical protein
MTPEQEIALFRYVGRHLTAIGGVCIWLDPSGAPLGTQSGVCFSGFVVEIDGIWYVITAGHILGQNFGDLVKNKSIVIDDCKFVDFLGMDAKTETPTHFSWYDISKFHLCDQDLGLDHGVFRLEESQARSMWTNGVVALSEANWIEGDTINAQQFMVFGFPTEELTSEQDGDVVTEYGRTCVAGLTPCPRPPHEPPTSYPQFVGKLNSHEPNDMDGFSGGPIFRYRLENGNLRYWLHAIQSAWLPDDRITFGCPMTIVAEHIRANINW